MSRRDADIGSDNEVMVSGYSEDTIAAIASGMTASGIGIIRISGPEAFAVLKRVFRPKNPVDPMSFRTNTIHYGHIVDPKYSGAVIDECLVMVMRAPHTYTTEDTVEINSHGGPYVMQKILELVFKNGARPAEPGEFTKRAFLGGRIDLTEAEAVMDVIGAKSEDALKSSLMQLSGSVRDSIISLREKLIHELAYIEAALDDPEHMDLTGYPETLLSVLAPIEEKIRRLSATFGTGKLIREGILTVILGKPNVGKSSLLNALIGEDRAIVTEIEGTTRDVLEENVRLGGICLRIIDTAGIRNARDQIEKIGIERARNYAEKADLILAIFDSARPLDENDREILQLVKRHRAIIVLNKSDLTPVVNEAELRRELAPVFSDGEDIPVIAVSAAEQTGIERLEEQVRKLFFSGKLQFNEETVITNARHFSALKAAGESLVLVRKSIEDGLPEDFYSIDLMDAYRSLGEIIGEEIDDDLVDTIFSQFCMGK